MRTFCWESLGLYFAVVAWVIGCGNVRTTHEPPTPEEAGSEFQEYTALESKLSARKTRLYSGRPENLTAHGKSVFWENDDGAYITLTRLDSDTLERMTYTVKFGSREIAKYLYSINLVLVVRHLASGAQSLEAYDAHETNSLISTTHLGGSAETRRYFAVGGDAVFWIERSKNASLWRWAPEQKTEPEELFSLGDLEGDFWQLVYTDNALLLVIEGKIARIDSRNGNLSWLTEERPVHLGFPLVACRAGALFIVDPFGRRQVKFFDSSSRTMTNLSETVERSVYRLNDAFADIHKSPLRGQIADGMFVYENLHGIFLAKLDHDFVSPVLLHSYGTNVNVGYSNPVMAGRKLFVVETKAAANKPGEFSLVMVDLADGA